MSAEDKRQKTEKVLKAIREAGLEEARADLDTSDLLTLHAGGYTTASRIKAAQREGLQACGLVPAAVDLILTSLRKGELDDFVLCSMS
jgi:hypothetical protein